MSKHEDLGGLLVTIQTRIQLAQRRVESAIETLDPYETGANREAVITLDRALQQLDEAIETIKDEWDKCHSIPLPQ